MLPNFTVKAEEENKSYGRFIVEPLAQGYGQTLGNVLRRVLLTSLSGAAVTQVKIKGVPHQFHTISGLKEDVVEFLLNVKKIRLKLHGDKPGKMEINVRGPRTVTAGDIKLPENVEIVNKDLYLGELSDSKSKLDVDFVVENGEGYVMAEERQTNEVGVIPLDSLFSPVVRVNYKVDATRVGRLTNFDKITLEIWTDGTISPKAALDQASKVLVSMFKAIYEPIVPKEEVKESSEAKLSEELSKMTVEELDLPTRITNSLRKGGIKTVGQLCETPRKKLMKIKNLGVRSIELIDAKLKEKGCVIA